ncbi:biopolymer transporter ExbD [Thalassoglobus polymorphus]|uniref:Biopolymer transport protein ExbD/TolR n=1 Tax=Thalassoglobus polymorphus TaxID=2527994 RepID=A0A517QU43_9PLAN|nr:biopolymer transporter ExbD [Thalassoglobus polymorphus]QDT35077.1 Biopolymer transport protein ExbD/TolR [Thalassoglobus polymorphus]
MPIIFRCSNCGQKLSVTRKKAGKAVTCPECVQRITVPAPKELSESHEPEDADASGKLELELVRNEQAQLSESEIQTEWSKKRNPWIESEEEEDDDFNLGSADLEESGLDMTPMVDVTFLLLIFFMITASFSMQKSQPATPPEPDEEGVSQSVTMEDLEEESVVVELDEENTIRVDDVPVSGIGELTDVLAAKIGNEGKTEMLIEAHPNAKHGLVVAVTDAGIEVQMQRIRRAVKKSDD